MGIALSREYSIVEQDQISTACQRNHQKKIGRYLLINSVCTRAYRSNSTEELRVCAEIDRSLGLSRYYHIVDLETGRDIESARYVPSTV